MLIRILLIGSLALGLMVAIKHGTILRGIGLLADCEVVEAPKNADGEWQACTDGRLDGRRDLSDMCKPMGVRGKLEYWECP